MHGLIFTVFFEKEKSLEVIGSEAQKIILNIRRANRSNSFKESIDLSGALMKSAQIDDKLENLGLDQPVFEGTRD